MIVPFDTYLAIAKLEHSQNALRSLAHQATGAPVTAVHLPRVFELIAKLDAEIAAWQEARRWQVA